MFVLCSLRDDIRKLFVITELHKHLAIFNSAAEALSHIQDRAP
jgi:anti-anti-sigma regulatory factor